jgi:hypothetical protein
MLNSIRQFYELTSKSVFSYVNLFIVFN